MSEEKERTTFVVARDSQPICVKLRRNAKGQYQWEIEFKGDNADAILYALDYLDSALKERYLGPLDVFAKTEGLIESVRKAKPPLLEGGKEGE
jgi:hypothetical protein